MKQVVYIAKRIGDGRSRKRHHVAGPRRGGKGRRRAHTVDLLDLVHLVEHEHSRIRHQGIHLLGNAGEHLVIQQDKVVARGVQAQLATAHVRPLAGPLRVMEVQNARRGRAEAGRPLVNPRAERAHGADHDQTVDLASETKIPERPQGRSGFARTRNAEVR